MNWFTRLTQGITTDTKDKKNIKEGLWYKCKKCKKLVSTEEHEKNLGVCECGFHERISSKKYFEIIFDKNKYTEINENLISVDILEFKDSKRYTKRLKAGKKKTGLNDAITTCYGKIDKMDLMIASMNFEFIGGSMGSVVGEKISRAIDFSIKNNMAFMIISKSGGARMMEAGFSLMQMAKTSAKLTLLARKKLPYISFLTDPTTGGVTASYAMLGDLNIAEPEALIGFAGPRVIKETIGKDLPIGFQRSEFLLEKGFLDFIVERKLLKKKIAMSLKLFAS
ncbi:MAG: acetyl-CoA carboxylase carboxyl transferase subunit beta [Bacteroidetes bacterium 4572_128]|nr:MAG: acetyl-CoA carboxylase carboxyl transferase subunit beta [Bacteroidetes bacterium 4572_128]